MEFIGFSFIQGVLAFLAPCAIALLPGYILAFVSRNTIDTAVSSPLIWGLKLVLWSIFGILAIYALAGGLILLAGHILKGYMKWISLGMGGVLILIGILMLTGRNISFSLNIREPNTKTETLEAFFFGIAYAIGALGCLSRYF
jgi:cytochrome c-type biogenesis protein